MRASIRLLILFLSSIGNSTYAAGPETGSGLVRQGNATGATACVTCHGADGAGNAASGFPRLAGLDAGYLKKQLLDFQNGRRSNALMEPIAKGLSAAEASAVAAYYAAQKTGAAAQAAGDPQMLARGARTAQRGQWEKTVPACVSCHGPGGRGIGAHFPALAGQHASYIVAQFGAWRDGSRRNDPWELMQSVAERLSEEDIAAVAAYFASLDPEP